MIRKKKISLNCWRWGYTLERFRLTNNVESAYKKKIEKNSTPILGSMTFNRSSVSQALYPNHTRNCRKVNTKLLQKQLKIQKEMKKN